MFGRLCYFTYLLTFSPKTNCVHFLKVYQPKAESIQAWTHVQFALLTENNVFILRRVIVSQESGNLNLMGTVPKQSGETYPRFYYQTPFTEQNYSDGVSESLDQCCTIPTPDIHGVFCQVLKMCFNCTCKYKNNCMTEGCWYG